MRASSRATTTSQSHSKEVPKPIAGVIVTLGRYSLARFLPGTPIGKVHGQGRKLNGIWIVHTMIVQWRSESVMWVISENV